MFEFGLMPNFVVLPKSMRPPTAPVVSMRPAYRSPAPMKPCAVESAMSGSPWMVGSGCRRPRGDQSVVDFEAGQDQRAADIDVLVSVGALRLAPVLEGGEDTVCHERPCRVARGSRRDGLGA